MLVYTYSLLTLLALVILTKVPVAVAMHRSNAKGYDNRTPRQQQAALTGWGSRALAAHQNTFEALAIYSAALLAATISGSLLKSQVAEISAITHTCARIAYPVLYIADIHWARSLVWIIGFGSALVMASVPLTGW